MKFLNQIHCGILLIGAVALITAAPNSEFSLEPTDSDNYDYINENFDNQRDELVFGDEKVNDVEKGSSETHEEHDGEDHVIPNWTAEDCEELCQTAIMKIYPKCDKWCKQME
ncbi:unnamed protein product [Diamesa tonsa]